MEQRKVEVRGVVVTESSGGSPLALIEVGEPGLDTEFHIVCMQCMPLHIEGTRNLYYRLSMMMTSVRTPVFIQIFGGIILAKNLNFYPNRHGEEFMLKNPLAPHHPLALL